MEWSGWGRTFATMVGACAVVVACSSVSAGTGGGGCTNDYSGRWKMSGSCTNTSCDVTQNACSLTVRCDDGSQGSGTLQGNNASIGGLLGSGDSGSCSVAFSGATFTMQCTSTRGAQPCSGTASCESGSCGKPIVSSSSSSGDSGPSGRTVPCRQKAGSDTDADCATQTGKPRKLDCDESDTATAVAAGCTPVKPGDSDVCCPLGVTGVSDPSPTDAGPPKLTCAGGSPQLFAPIPNKGPACGAGVRCNVGQTCCNDRPAGTFTCAASCPAGVTRVDCYNAAECAGNPGGSICCAKGTPDENACASYLVVRGYAGSVCSTSCRAGEYRACSGDGDCASGTCTAAFLTNDAQTTTVPFSVGVCR